MPSLRPLVTGSAVLILGAIFVLVALAFAPYVNEVIQEISNGIAEAKSLDCLGRALD